MSTDVVINNFKRIVVTKPVDVIIGQIRELITSGQLKPGDKLPSERKLSEKLNIGRTHVRDALRKLEFHGVLKTLPQSGTVVAGIGMTALEGLISDVLHLEKTDFTSLVEIRVILEIESVRLAAQRRTDSDLKGIEKALIHYQEKIRKNENAVDEDMMFHLKIAEASQNKVLKSLMLIIIPDIIANYSKFNICSNEMSRSRYHEHKQLFNAILHQDIDLATQIMKDHLQDILKQGRGLKF